MIEYAQLTSFEQAQDFFCAVTGTRSQPARVFKQLCDDGLADLYAALKAEIAVKRDRPSITHEDVMPLLLKYEKLTRFHETIMFLQEITVQVNPFAVYDEDFQVRYAALKAEIAVERARQGYPADGSQEIDGWRRRA